MYRALPADLTQERLARLRDRSTMLAAVRSFFQERSICEVDCPCLNAAASVEAHIDLMTVKCHGGEVRYLHSSPEFGMKRLLAEGMGNIYQLSHVFRDGEQSTRHNPEFTLIEWYRVDQTFTRLIDETLDLVRLFFEALPAETISYREALQHYVGIDYVHTTSQQLYDLLRERGVEPHLTAESPKDDLLNVLLAIFVEPYLGHGCLTALTDYPATQAAFAQTHWKGDEHVAKRFEVYYKGVELANGFHELADTTEQRERFEEANAARVRLGKPALPIDEQFLGALQKGLPDCCGVAVGFDRLMMLRHDISDIRAVLPFSWKNS